MIKIGFGYDAHKLNINSSNKSIKLFGILVKTKFRILAVSNGDVGLHSLSNAILGACGLDDIGVYFPCKSTDRNYKSHKIFMFAFAKLEQAGFSISNIDVTIVCDVIMIQQYKKQIKENISKITNLNCQCISVKATTSDKGASAPYLSCYTSLLIAK